jgi:hypothetical protein
MPIGIADDSEGLTVFGGIVVHRQRASNDWANAKNREVVSAYQLGMHHLWLRTRATSIDTDLKRTRRVEKSKHVIRKLSMSSHL